MLQPRLKRDKFSCDQKLNPVSFKKADVMKSLFLERIDYLTKIVIQY
jgi:hypothetical protein